MCKHNAIPSDPLIHGKPEKERKLEEAFFFIWLVFCLLVCLLWELEGIEVSGCLLTVKGLRKIKKEAVCICVCLHVNH